ncbi:MAG TPA: GspH/FimT family pseudopilin [Thermoanaerobaculia bacterium]|nr:GspH/FimT family pseudopilin [Thermoanaerobaculia bacterium]
MIELIGVVGILLIMAVVGYPALSTWLDQQRVLGFVNDASVQLVRARQEAVQRGVPVIAQADPASGRIRIWADVDDNRAYNPDSTAVARTVDYQIGVLMLPTQTEVMFAGPGGMIEGLTAMPTGENAFVFEPDGSIRHVGALRIADDMGNFFELRVEPKATGKTQVRKYNPAPSWGDAAGWYEKGNVPSTGAPTWVWNGSVDFSGGGGGGGGQGGGQGGGKGGGG